MRQLAIGLMLTLANPAVAAAPVTSGLSDADTRRNAEQLAYAVGALRSGDAQGAIDRYLDPILARYDAAYGKDSRRIFSSRGPEETVAYMLQAAGSGRSAVALDGFWVSVLYNKGFALVELGRHDDARRTFEHAAELAPLNALVLSELGNLDQVARNWNGAISRFEAAIEASKFSPPEVRDFELTRAMRGVGFSLIELGRLDDAEAMFRKCLAIDSTDKGALGELAYIAELRAKAGKPAPTT